MSATDGGAGAGVVPASPWRLDPREWRDAVARAAREFLADDCLGMAKEVAYSSILAFFPTMILLVGLFGLLDIYDDLIAFVAVVAPTAVVDALEIAERSAGGRSALAFVLGAVGAAWAASGAMGTIMKAVNRAYDQQERRPLWKRRVVALALVVATALMVAALLLLIVFGEPLGEAVAARARLGGAFDLVWGVVRWPIASLAILLFLALVYYVGPTVPPRGWRWISPGSVVAAALWLLFSYLFSLYTSYAGTYDETYGSLAGGIVFLLWLDFSALALLFGAELNAELDREADLRDAGGPRAGLVEPGRRTR